MEINIKKIEDPFSITYIGKLNLSVSVGLDKEAMKLSDSTIDFDRMTKAQIKDYFIDVFYKEILDEIYNKYNKYNELQIHNINFIPEIKKIIDKKFEI